MTRKEVKIIAYCRRPTGVDRVRHHLTRLAMHKRMDGNDPERTAYLIGDHTQRFLRGEVTEVEMAIMVEHFIENDTSAFFPQYAEMKKFIIKEFGSAEWSQAFKKDGHYD